MVLLECFGFRMPWGKKIKDFRIQEVGLRNKAVYTLYSREKQANKSFLNKEELPNLYDQHDTVVLMCVLRNEVNGTGLYRLPEMAVS